MRDQPFAALNAALFADGFVLEVAPGVIVEQPIEIIHSLPAMPRQLAAHPQPHRRSGRAAG